MITKSDVTAMIYEKKHTLGLTWAQIAEAIGMSEVFTTSACLGMNSLTKDKADALVTKLGLPPDTASVLVEFPTKVYSQLVPTDPCVYRFYEILGVYGDTLKELIQEKGGDGIMSAVDFHMGVDKIPNAKGAASKLK